MSQRRSGAYPSAELLRFQDIWEARGLPGRDTKLIARTVDIGIWHTEKCRSHESPEWVPPFGDVPAVYRGFDIERLPMVLETGLDVPARSAFFATPHCSKAWEYPAGRQLAAILILDQTCTERSYVAEPLSADPPTRPDPATFHSEYVDEGLMIYTRFERDRGTRTFRYEQMYGYWLPGDARAALLGVVIGGRYSTVQRLFLTMDWPLELLGGPTP